MDDDSLEIGDVGDRPVAVVMGKDKEDKVGDALAVINIRLRVHAA